MLKQYYNQTTAGSATIFGMDTVRQSVDIRARVGHLPQEPYVYENMTAREALRDIASCFFKAPKRPSKIGITICSNWST